MRFGERNMMSVSVKNMNHLLKNVLDENNWKE